MIDMRPCVRRAVRYRRHKSISTLIVLVSWSIFCFAGVKTVALSFVSFFPMFSLTSFRAVVDAFTAGTPTEAELSPFLSGRTRQGSTIGAVAWP